MGDFIKNKHYHYPNTKLSYKVRLFTGDLTCMYFQLKPAFFILQFSWLSLPMYIKLLINCSKPTEISTAVDNPFIAFTLIFMVQLTPQTHLELAYSCYSKILFDTLTQKCIKTLTFYSSKCFFRKVQNAINWKFERSFRKEGFVVGGGGEIKWMKYYLRNVCLNISYVRNKGLFNNRIYSLTRDVTTSIRAGP